MQKSPRISSSIGRNKHAHGKQKRLRTSLGNQAPSGCLGSKLRTSQSLEFPLNFRQTLIKRLCSFLEVPHNP